MERDFLLEEDLYIPVRDYLVGMGFTVRGEVGHCDVFAVRDDKVLIVELKKGLTIDLLIQAANRQKVADSVYIAIPKPKVKVFSKRWRDICHLIRRLELGFITVSRNKKNCKVDIVFEPSSFDQKKSRQLSKKQRRALLDEFNGRSFDANIGGCTGKKIITVYKEQAIEIAEYIKKNGSTSAKELENAGFDRKRAYSILYNNFYGWFERIENGIYNINDKGRADLEKVVEMINISQQR